MLSHGHHLGDNRALRPFHPKHFSQLPQVSGCCLPNGEDGVAEPSHAEVTELLIEELNAQLASKKRDIFDDGKSNTPLLIFSQLNNSGQERLGQEVDADNCKS